MDMARDGRRCCKYVVDPRFLSGRPIYDIDGRKLLTSYFLLPVECFGYGIRIASAKDTSKKPPFVAQYVLIVLAPVLMTGIIYVTFGRIVFHVVPAEHRSTKLLWVPRK